MSDDDKVGTWVFAELGVDGEGDDVDIDGGGDGDDERFVTGGGALCDAG